MRFILELRYKVMVMITEHLFSLHPFLFFAKTFWAFNIWYRIIKKLLILVLRDNVQDPLLLHRMMVNINFWTIILSLFHREKLSEMSKCLVPIDRRLGREILTSLYGTASRTSHLGECAIQKHDLNLFEFLITFHTSYQNFIKTAYGIYR